MMSWSWATDNSLRTRIRRQITGLIWRILEMEFVVGRGRPTCRDPDQRNRGLPQSSAPPVWPGLDQRLQPLLAAEALGLGGARLGGRHEVEPLRAEPALRVLNPLRRHRLLSRLGHMRLLALLGEESLQGLPSDR